MIKNSANLYLIKFPAAPKADISKEEVPFGHTHAVPTDETAPSQGKS